jgi:hypothetical protein
VVGLFLAIAPTLLIVCLSGFGAALQIALVGRRRFVLTQNMFESAFYGLFLVTAAAFVINLFLGLGTDPGPYVLVLGLAFFVMLQWRGVQVRSAPAVADRRRGNFALW